ncbi:MAG TPA: hypothetical protein VHL31_00895 [Geminicoccus sp.]|jgi:hypothetical protein|uniref:hypothetical protein n=1 Tax=Geminicoccus sp. TaxID=2024832 RepID=UPI002E2EFCAA|nr:hypothetical protein [Geminicoccus sp.]HEX2524846.1 hypothetical protein [Geminicoccus sp.]
MPEQKIDFEALSNIEVFNLATAKIFALLYEKFPVRIPLIPNDIAAEMISEELYYSNEPRGPGIAITEKHLTPLGRRYHRVTSSTVSWLVKFEYIDRPSQYDHDRSFAGRAMSSIMSNNHVLTPKGLDALAAVPEALTSKRTAGEQLVELSKGAGGEAGRAAIGEIIGHIISGTARGFGFG